MSGWEITGRVFVLIVGLFFAIGSVGDGNQVWASESGWELFGRISGTAVGAFLIYLTATGI